MKNKYLKIIGILFLIFISIPLIHLLTTKLKEKEENKTIKIGYTNDVSELNLTKVDTIISAPKNKDDIVKELNNILKSAKNNSKKISISGAKHSMGGHTMYPNGIVLNMLPYNHMEFDSIKNILTIGSGALWKDALLFLDKRGKSISVMQAFNSFSIGGSLSVNGHGWQKNKPPIASSVVSFTLMTENGDIKNCSRTENKELFKLVIGGYGLFGIILDVRLKVVDNMALRYKYVNMDSKDYVENYEKHITENPNVNLVFGRLSVSNKNFLEQATINYFEKTDKTPETLETKKNNEVKRLVFRGSVNSEYGKRLRWDLEKTMNSVIINTLISRNELLNDDVSLIENKDPNSTDILHEYFIPKRNFNAFVESLKPILQGTTIDLLNITIRSVEKDIDSYMNYANEQVFGFVILFNQQKTNAQEQEMKALTDKLINETIANNGTFYLPYRLHVKKDKMREIYPQTELFFNMKLKYDPTELFSNKFYEYYK